MSKVKEQLDRIRDLPDEELTEALRRAREELFKLKLGNFTNQVENTLSVRAKRREVARIETVVRARSLGFEQQATTRAGGRTGSRAKKTEKEE